MEYLEGAEEMGMDGKDYGTGGNQPKGLGDIFQGGSAGGSIIQVGDVGTDPPHGTGPRKLPAQVLQEDNREAYKVTGGWGMGLPTTGDSDGGGGFL